MSQESNTMVRLMDGMEDLLAKNRLDKITVSMITDSCGLSRTVFYKYFENKDDLCMRHMENIFDKAFVPQNDFTWRQLACQNLSEINRHLAFFRAMARTPLMSKKDVLFQNIYRQVYQTYYSMIAYRLGKEPDEDTLFLLKSYCVGGLSILTDILKNSRLEDVAHLVELFEESMPVRIGNLLLDFEFPKRLANKK